MGHSSGSTVPEREPGRTPKVSEEDELCTPFGIMFPCSHGKCISHTHFSGEGTEAQMASTPAHICLLIRSELGSTTKLIWEYWAPKPIRYVCPTLILDKQDQGWWADAAGPRSGPLNFRTEPEGRGCLEKTGWQLKGSVCSSHLSEKEGVCPPLGCGQSW